MNSKSFNDKLFNSLKSNKSNKTFFKLKFIFDVRIKKFLIHLIFSSNLDSENKIKPLNNSKASINPFPSVSHMRKSSSLV